MNLKNMMYVTNLLFFTGITGIVLNRNNLLVILMSIEVMLLAINLNFITFSIQFDDLVGQICSIFILSIAAAESAIGLAIISVYNIVRNSIRI